MTDLMQEYREDVFSKIQQDKVDMKGLRVCKALLAEQMMSTVLVDVTTRFRSRCVKLCLLLGAENKGEASKFVNAAFFQKWKDVPAPYLKALKRVLPPDPAKNSTFYDLKARPEKYFEATLRLCRELGDK
jgi:hypothetical protein